MQTKPRKGIERASVYRKISFRWVIIKAILIKVI